MAIKLKFSIYNKAEDKIKEILEYGLKNNVDYIKFLELLVIEGKEEIYKYLYWWEIKKRLEYYSS